MKHIKLSKLNKFFILTLSVSLFSGCSWFKTSETDSVAAGATSAVVQVEDDENRSIKVKTKEELENYVKTEKNVVIDFFGPWCPPCKKMMPINEELAKKYPSVKILEVDIDLLKEVASDYGVMGIPLFIFVKDGQEVDRKVGAMGKAEYDGKLKTVFGL